MDQEQSPIYVTYPVHSLFLKCLLITTTSTATTTDKSMRDATTANGIAIATSISLLVIAATT